MNFFNALYGAATGVQQQTEGWLKDQQQETAYQRELAKLQLGMAKEMGLKDAFGASAKRVGLNLPGYEGYFDAQAAAAARKAKGEELANSLTGEQITSQQHGRQVQDKQLAHQIDSWFKDYTERVRAARAGEGLQRMSLDESRRHNQASEGLQAQNMNLDYSARMAGISQSAAQHRDSMANGRFQFVPATDPVTGQPIMMRVSGRTGDYEVLSNVAPVPKAQDPMKAAVAQMLLNGSDPNATPRPVPAPRPQAAPARPPAQQRPNPTRQKGDTVINNIWGGQ